MTGTALVTGGTGYIGGEVITRLLRKGWTVHTTVRSKAKSERALYGRWAGAEDRLRVFEADLMDDAGWAEANAGCTHVAHVASPFPVGIPKHEDELVVPAREGTLRALRFAHAAGIGHFVQTSSSAAIAYGHPASKTTFDERDWTNPDAPGIQPYIKSKTVAERAARDWVADNAPDMAFCSINPVAVLGPVASHDFAASIEIVRRLLTGEIPAIPNIGLTTVDVRDVADLHVLALEADRDTIRGERFAAAADFFWMADIARILRAELGPKAAKIPTRRMPDFVLKIMALFSSEIRQVSGEVGKRKVVSGAHAKDVLGWTTIPGKQTIVDTANSLIQHGIVRT
ncbi:NAD-dependent epimerase/dehydratase family protein [Tsuneonella amylolytica]|uniref:NAD-dependent epimerase/dehydratase family protein n=1 Tax=Tsuneonella amylolytica TaxID=2338327 RepID=UPI000EAAB1E1|nr:NAD-dependent epimerase/dehydratase family protein [Tsuneonella amylolytica]